MQVEVDESDWDHVNINSSLLKPDRFYSFKNDISTNNLAKQLDIITDQNANFN